mgnify:CR=1 FL=1
MVVSRSWTQAGEASVTQVLGGAREVGKQPVRVVVLLFALQVDCIAQLDDLTVLHHGDAVADLQQQR